VLAIDRLLVRRDRSHTLDLLPKDQSPVENDERPTKLKECRERGRKDRIKWEELYSPAFFAFPG
jgi:hypothetical protein